MTNPDTAMKPVAVNGCFAWLHTPPHEAKDVAVLLCQVYSPMPLVMLRTLALYATALLTIVSALHYAWRTARRLAVAEAH